MPYEDIGFIACFILLIPFPVNNYFLKILKILKFFVTLHLDMCKVYPL